MEKFRRLITFIQYILAAWRQTFGREEPRPSDGDQTTTEQMEGENWEKAKAEYERQMKQLDKDFWRGEGEK